MAVCVVFGEQRTNELLMNPDLLTYSRPKVMRSVQLLFGIITLGIAAYIVSLSSYWYVVRNWRLILFYSFRGVAQFVIADSPGTKGLPAWASL